VLKAVAAFAHKKEGEGQREGR